jgi:hypothetical protein
MARRRTRSKGRRIRVRRKGYKRKAFTEHRNGRPIHEPAARVPRTTYYEEDRGAPGRTPEENRWYKATGTLNGWSISEDAEQRHRALEETARQEGWGKVEHKLIGLHNVTTSEKTKMDAEDDVAWIQEAHGKELHESLKRQRPNPVTGGMTEAEIRKHRKLMLERRRREIEDSIGVRVHGYSR